MTERRRLLENRVAIVTGGANGLGAAIVDRFIEQGARGVILDMHSDSHAQLPDSWRALRADVRDPNSLRAAFDEVVTVFSKVDIVVANAGIVPPWTSTSEIDLDSWENVFAINSRGVMLTIREAVRVMSPHGGSIIAMSSLNGWRGDPHIPAYAASKHAVVGLVRSVAQDVGRQGIRVNAVGPGPIATEALLERMASRSTTTGLDVDAALHRAGESTALGRVATASEVADAVLFLASDMASGITGHLLPVDAGVL
jgi:NAD(P)-dependent dehydrogenase (short-subunit alcohol dehydrogenase family)